MTHFAAIALMVAGLGQTGGPEGIPEDALSVNLFVNYGTAFRANAWTPVDIRVANNRQAIRGHAEVVVTDLTGAREPAVYRLPIDSPKPSRKQFRLYCYLGERQSIEAALYAGGRRVQGSQTWYEAEAIPPGDVMCLILDDDSRPYNFLFTALQSEPADLGLHREYLNSSQLDRLGRRLEAYRPFNSVCFGDIQAADVAPEQQAALYDYVQAGGTLVVTLGAYAEGYRGTWVEELAGVRIGANMQVDERRLFQATFGGRDPAGLRPRQSVVVTRLAPQAASLERVGEEITLASRRRLGLGQVIVCAISLHDDALTGAPAYQSLWRSWLTHGGLRGYVAWDNAGAYMTQQMRGAAGVKALPRSAAAKYLLGYTVFGMLGGWLLFSLLKRRELFFAALLLIAAAFTAFAYYDGARGRAKIGAKREVNVLRVYSDSNRAQRQSLVAMLKPSTAVIDAPLAGEQALARLAYGAFSMSYAPAPSMSRGGRGAFTLLQGQRSVIEDFRLGASEIRTVQTRSRAALPGPGGIAGEIVLDGEEVQVDLVNRTGYRLRNAHADFGVGVTPLGDAGPGQRMRAVTVLRPNVRPGAIAGGSSAPRVHPLVAALLRLPAETAAGRTPRDLSTGGTGGRGAYGVCAMLTGEAYLVAEFDAEGSALGGDADFTSVSRRDVLVASVPLRVISAPQRALAVFWGHAAPQGGDLSSAFAQVVLTAPPEHELLLDVYARADVLAYRQGMGRPLDEGPRPAVFEPVVFELDAGVQWRRTYRLSEGRWPGPAWVLDPVRVVARRHVQSEGGEGVRVGPGASRHPMPLALALRMAPLDERNGGWRPWR